MPNITFPFTHDDETYEISIVYERVDPNPHAGFFGDYEWSVDAVPQSCPFSTREVEHALDEGAVLDAIDEHHREALR